MYAGNEIGQNSKLKKELTERERERERERETIPNACMCVLVCVCARTISSYLFIHTSILTFCHSSLRYFVPNLDEAKP